jgi:acyl-CoA thioester hydrolase
MEVVKRPESKVLIRFPDCDPFNHLNNARYLDYFINAREDHVAQHYGLNAYAYAAEKGLSWVVTQNQIAYLRPAMLMENVIVQSHLLHYRERDLKVEMMMWDEQHRQLKSLLWTTFTHYNFKTNKAEVHSADLMDLFKSVADPLTTEMSFEERVKEIRTNGFV